MAQYILKRHLVNFQLLEGAALYDASGVAFIPLGFCPAGYNLEIERIVSDASSGIDFTLYAGSADTSLAIREHATITIDPVQVFDESSLIRFQPNEAIIAVFTGGTPGDQVTCVAQGFTVLYQSVPLPDEYGPGTVVSRGLHDVGTAPADEGVGWN